MVTSFVVQSGRQVILDAFDRLFAKAANKLRVEYTPEDLAAAKRSFEQRYAPLLEAISAAQVENVPPEVIEEMERAIENLSPAQVVGHLASVPLVHQAQEILRMLALQAAQQRLLEHVLAHASDEYGGN